MIGDRIKELRKDMGLNQEAFARLARTSKQYVSQLERGVNREPAPKYIQAWAKAGDVRMEWLTSGKLPKETSGDDMDWPPILAYKTAAALGEGAIPDEYAETHKLKFRADSLRGKGLRGDQLGVVYGRGDSMLPRIKSGDAILFDTSDTKPRDGKLYVVTYGGNLLAKQLSLLGGRWFIESLNKDDPKWRKPEPIDEHRGFEIHGRVRWIGSWED